jgi:glutamate-1-semialdehyde 2,1-aminomutase
MYPELQKELATFERRTPKSAESHKRNLKRIPLGVASNYRAYDPYPIFVKEGRGSHFRDLDGNDYLDHNLCFGALMAGHCHPAVMKAVEKRLSTGTMFGMPHDMEWQLAEEICDRFPVEMLRFGSSGTEATMHAIRLARAATGRDKIIKFEGGYHGLHDSALVSVKPHAPDFGDVHAPTSVSGCDLQRSGDRRAAFQTEPGRDCGRHSRAHHDERRTLHAPTGLPRRPA